MIAIYPIIPAKAGTQVLATGPLPEDGAARTLTVIAAAQAWVPAFAGVHGLG